MDNKLKELVKELKRIDIISNQKEILKTNRSRLIQRRDRIEELLDNKEIEIDKLSRLTLSYLIKQILNRRESSLESVKHEYLNLSIEFNSLTQSIEKVDFELGVLERRRENSSEIREQIRAYFLQEETRLSSTLMLEYRKVAKRLLHKLEVYYELEEAVTQGMRINRKMNSAIKYLEREAERLSDNEYSRKQIVHYQLRKLEKYQKYVIDINHNFVMYESELNDVYRIIFSDQNYSSRYLEDFMSNYRINLLTDLSNKKTLNSSWSFIKRYKEIILNLNRILRKDMKQIMKEIRKLEKREEELVEDLKKY